jgi:hypothetical protein
MHAVLLVPIVFILVGLALWWLGTKKPWPIVAKVGEFCVFCGLFWLVYMLTNSALAISVTEHPRR